MMSLYDDHIPGCGVMCIGPQRWFCFKFYAGRFWSAKHHSADTYSSKQY
jgi:hypothetical protein